jgi:hypothetical protein
MAMSCHLLGRYNEWSEAFPDKCELQPVDEDSLLMVELLGTKTELLFTINSCSHDGMGPDSNTTNPGSEPVVLCEFLSEPRWRG